MARNDEGWRKRMKIVIIGGVAGGMSAATRLRRLQEDAEIIVFEKGPYVSFANCGLPYYVSGEIAERDALLLQTPESLSARFALDVRPEHEVLEILPTEHKVVVQTPAGIQEETYDKLILSPGAKPVLPPIPGLAEAQNVFTLRNVPDVDKIMRQLTGEVQRAVVIGAGFIGLEMAENLRMRGLDVTIVEQAPHVLPPLDEEMAAFVKKELMAHGVEVITGESAAAFEAQGKQIRLSNGRALAADLTLLSVGVAPDSSLAQQAGLQTGLRGGIVVDDTYRTSEPDIYAVGDAILVKQQLTGEPALIALASPANRQGRQVADVLSGIQRKNRGSIGTAILRTFGLTAASVGLNERAASETGRKIGVVHTNGKDHAGYYPGATDLTLKLIFDQQTGELLGAQGVGAKGVDKRIDVLATAIKAGLTVADLPELELTYAPPFGSAKDPVNMLGYAALNLLEGLSHNIQWHQLTTELAEGKILLDVRTEEEVAAGHFPEYLNIPLSQLRARLEELDPTKEYIVSCHSGLRSYIAERILQQHGFKVVNLDGAYALYAAVMEK